MIGATKSRLLMTGLVSGALALSLLDWYERDYYAYSPAKNPPGPERGSLMPDGKAYRAMRGGNWYNGENGHGRVSNRNPSYYRGPQDPDHPYYHVGFRVVLPVAAESRPVIKPTPVRAAPGTTDDRRPPPPGNGRDGGGPGQADSPQRGQRQGGGRGGQGGRGGPAMAENKLPASPNPGQTVGLYLNTPRAYDGYTLLAPKHNTVTYLIDNQGRIVNQWKSDYEPGQSAYLLPNGHLLRAGMVRVPGGTGGGEGGRIEEIVPPVDAGGRCFIAPGKAYGPEQPVWRYEARNRTDFFSSEISGAHRLPSGNTLVCAGVAGNLFEVTPAGETVWQYISPVVRGGILAQGEIPGKDVRGHLFNAVFKVHRYAPDYPGLRGRDLSPKGVIELPASQKGKTGLDKADAPAGEGGRGRGRGGLAPQFRKGEFP